MSINSTYAAKNWIDMIRPTALEVDNDVLKPNYGKFVAKPLERGYGLTLGNSLRRVLLSSIQGAGIVAVKIDGVEHEFGTINNVKEEVSEIILNLKEVKFKITDKEEVNLVLEKTSEGAVMASDIAESANVEVLNPEHVICNISSGGSIRMELKIARGKGYVSALDNKEQFDLPIGWIYLDTLFSPVHRVNYTVTNARVGKRTDYDKLTLEVGEMLRTKNFGRKSLNEIKEILTQMGLGLGMKVDSIMKQVQGGSEQ
jgi:DNA-directed RNA polymerase subunit alpha